MERRVIAVRGTVQGVGFRPFVYGLAAKLQLGGSVSNHPGGVTIEVEGEAGQVEAFLADLTYQPPPLARIEGVCWERREPRGQREFQIGVSATEGRGEVAISPDVATCAECLRELFDPGDRRYRYPFLNCTNCGPRLTIVRGYPYDRARTTMGGFALCAACRAEYEDPGNRRFHAQPTACAACGPSLGVADGQGRLVEAEDALGWFVEALRSGGIGALKGLGGYHLVCDGRCGEAVRELRRRKGREEKPFAVMVADVRTAEGLCEVREAERGLLESCRRPIVLLRKGGGAAAVEGCAPGNVRLGVMLPYTPLHHLLMAEMGSGSVLVMTSGNRSDEPIATGEPEVFERLRGIADAFLTHNRPIHVRCDDSVMRVEGVGSYPVRRSRGYAPEGVQMPVTSGRALLAVGGQLKNTFGLLGAGGGRAILSQHVGYLDHLAALRAFERDIGLYERLFGIEPRVLVHDLHPDYASTRYARKRAEAEGLRLIGVQHHHAHVGACLAEHGLRERVIGVSFDGTGYGTDGAVWGGEFLLADLRDFERAAHLRYVAMPGADMAVREPWRMAVAHLMDAEVSEGSGMVAERVGERAVRTVEQMIRRRFNAPLTSSMGRLFDAVASLLGVRDRVGYEGQAAIELEALAQGLPGTEAYPVQIAEGGEGGGLEIDTRPMVRAIVGEVSGGEDVRRIARRFHSTIAQVVGQVCVRLRAATGMEKVVLSGGVFMNGVLLEETQGSLRRHGMLPLTHREVPANDGGISLGQLAIAAARIGESSCA